MDDSTSVGNDTSGFSFGGLLQAATGLANAGASVYSTVKGTAPAPQKTAVQTATSSNNTLYIVGGVVVAILVGVLFFMRRGR